VQEVAVKLRMNEETVRRIINSGELRARKTPDGEVSALVRDGRLRACKAGKRWLIPREEIVRYLGLDLFEEPDPGPERRKTPYELHMELKRA